MTPNSISTIIMKTRIFSILCLLILLGCNESKKGPGTSNDLCDKNLDSTLVSLSTAFHPNSLDLQGSMSDTLRTFISSIDSNCLRKQDYYKPFIITIFGKFYLYHMMCCHQSYDLYSMNKPSEAKLIREFEYIGGYSRSKYEMLSSGMVVNLIESDSTLLKIPEIKKLLADITEEGELILADPSVYRLKSNAH